jgi:hypothetical protein
MREDARARPLTAAERETVQDPNTIASVLVEALP